ncbi:hypothetical protein DT076_16845 [Desertihabitans brevis]|uniref:Uncharacterized protein n=1 Tax=Desertihabitans brevis TaxID=2268447 RepID=A0A367YR58_9ACTN|nr:hypothetical protein [Desertihabitans brevis]RCK68314.1 hypothetical protein DT076_16845 [Desertihabitans brevis]
MKSRHPLGVLITDAMEANGWSYGDLADRSTRAGYPVSRQAMNMLAENPVKTVNADAIRRVAAATGVSERKVIVAFVRSLGLSWSEDVDDDRVEAAIRDDGRLSVEDKGLLLAMVEQMRGRHRGGTVSRLRPGGPPNIPPGAEVMPGDVAAYDTTVEDPVKRRRREQDEAAERGDS